MRVRATKLGYYGLVRRKEGDVFDIESDKDFSKNWMEPVGPPSAGERAEEKKADTAKGKQGKSRRVI